MAGKPQPLLKKFNKGVSIPNGIFGCWVWKGARFPTGYGGIGHEYKTLYAHRVSYLLYHGDIPENLLVRHLCHNKSCVNPFHVSIGTKRDNYEDERKAGKLPVIPHHFGICHHGAIDPAVADKVLAFSEKASSAAVGRILGIGATTVKKIRSGNHWTNRHKENLT